MIPGKKRIRQGLPGRPDLDRDSYRFYEGVEYSRFWDGQQKHYLDALEHALVSRLLPQTGVRIVDLGCGHGRLADCYLERFQQVVMVDGSLSLLRQARERTGGRGVYIACDVNHLPFQLGAFDAVLLFRVFHHIADSRACLSMLSGLLSGGGRLVFNYCNKQNAERVAHWLARKKVENPFSRQPAGVGTTVISHHPAAVQSLLAEAGFRRLRSYGTGVLDHVSPRKSFSPGWVTLANGLAPLLAWTRVAPWIVCQADAGDAAGKLAITALDDLLQCPNCAAKVVAEAGGYRCSACGVRYPVEDDIIDFRIDKLELP